MNNKILATTISATAILVAAPLAHANGELQIYVGGVLEYDSGSQSSGSINEDYSSSGVTADLQAVWAGTLMPSMDLDQIEINGAGAVEIIFSSNENAPSGGPTTVNLAVTGHNFSTGTLNGTVSAYWDASDTLLATTTLLATESSLTGVNMASGSFDPTAPYSMTEVVNITSGSGDLTTDDSLSTTTSVPDGGASVAMLGTVFVGLAIFRYRAYKAAGSAQPSLG